MIFFGLKFFFCRMILVNMNLILFIVIMFLYICFFNGYFFKYIYNLRLWVLGFEYVDLIDILQEDNIDCQVLLKWQDYMYVFYFL